MTAFFFFGADVFATAFFFFVAFFGATAFRFFVLALLAVADFFGEVDRFFFWTIGESGEGASGAVCSFFALDASEDAIQRI